jgi:uncharacterized protein (DUF2236 family)
LPADPLGRLFSTVTYARQIIFSDEDAALAAIDKITAIHKGVEKSRGAQIPDWAYRDVLFLLIDYSIRSFELLERKLTGTEKADVFEVFHRVGIRMQLTGLPASYPEWVTMREEHLQQNLINSEFTADLYRQYKKHLGTMRYAIVKQVQGQLVPERVKNLLPLVKIQWIAPVLQCYKLSRIIKLDGPLKTVLLPEAYKQQIKGLDTF